MYIYVHIYICILLYIKKKKYIYIYIYITSFFLHQKTGWGPPLGPWAPRGPIKNTFKNKVKKKKNIYIYIYTSVGPHIFMCG